MATATGWGKVESTVALHEDGDILNVLRRIKEKYEAKACDLYEKALNNFEFGDAIRETADFYKQQAEIIQGMLHA